MQVDAKFHAETGTLTYLVWDEETLDAILIDPVLDFDPQAIRFSTDSLETVYAMIEQRGLVLRGVLDTHAHADHFTGMAAVRTRYGCPTVAGDGIRRVQEVFVPLYGIEDECPMDGSQFDHLMTHQEERQFGSIRVRAIHTPGHTPSCTCYMVDDLLFAGDTMFMPDFGTARADFPGADARALYRSIGEILSLPDETRLFTGHDYRPGGREPRWMATVAEQKRDNPHLQDMNEDRFVAMRERRDAELPLPDRMLAALQINIRGGAMPPAESNGQRYLKIPLDRF